MKFTDIMATADKANPNTTLDIELNGEEVTVVLRNIMRLTDEESKEVAEAMSIMDTEGQGEDSFTEEEKDQTASAVIASRIATALLATADDKESFKKFLDGLRDKGDFKVWMVHLFTAYAKETRLGEAERSDGS